MPCLEPLFWCQYRFMEMMKSFFFFINFLLFVCIFYTYFCFRFVVGSLFLFLSLLLSLSFGSKVKKSFFIIFIQFNQKKKKKKHLKKRANVFWTNFLKSSLKSYYVREMRVERVRETLWGESGSSPNPKSNTDASYAPLAAIRKKNLNPTLEQLSLTTIN